MLKSIAETTLSLYSFIAYITLSVLVFVAMVFCLAFPLAVIFLIPYLIFGTNIWFSVALSTGVLVIIGVVRMLICQ
jgi:hypothetical protein